MSIDFTAENEGRLLTVRVSGRLHIDVMNQIYEIVEDHSKSGMRQMMVLRQGSDTDFDFDSGVEFGQKIGDLLARTGVVVAVVRSTNKMEDITIDSMVFNSGVSLGQFNNEAEARDWLALKAEG